MTIEAFAPAKINLTLHVTGQRTDGYHLLDSLVVFAGVGDRLTISLDDKMSLDVTGDYASGVPTDNRNLVWQAAELSGLISRIKLEKNLPNAAGIGGGSADAAAVLRVAQTMGYGQDIDVAALGADVPVCLSDHPQRMRGVGDVLMPVVGVPDAWIVLVNPGVSVPTREVFANLTDKSNPAMEGSLPVWGSFVSFCSWLNQQRNDLEKPAIGCQPVIKDVLAMLSDARVTRMSGSGATCFGLYPSASTAATAALRIQKTKPNWWVCDSKIL